MQLARRKTLGAYYTPPNLARTLCDWAVQQAGERVLEPSVGNGALIQALLHRFGEVGKGLIVGCEINHWTVQRAINKFTDEPVSLHKANFLSLKVADLGVFDAVVANPPFTRNHTIAEKVRKQLRSRVEFNMVRGAPGLWAYFVIHSLEFLARGGKLALVAPGALEFADYAIPILDELSQKFSEVEIVRVFDTIKWEGDAQERPALVLASGFGMGPGPVRRSLLIGDTIRQADTQVLADPKPLKPAKTLGEVARLEIGVVTGANALFLLNREMATRNKIPESALVPVVSRARHIKGLFFDSKMAMRLSALGERTLLLYPKRGLGKRGSSTRRYLSQLTSKKRQSVLWFSKRKPWWRVQLGRPCDAVFTYMNELGPHLTLLGPAVTCTNTLHRVVFQTRDLAVMRTLSVSMLSTFTQLHAERLGRVYGGGVLKFELKDARMLPLLVPEKPIAEAVFNRVNTAITSGAIEHARNLADESLFPEFFGFEWKNVAADMDQRLRNIRVLRGVNSKRNKARRG